MSRLSPDMFHWIPAFARMTAWGVGSRRHVSLDNVPCWMLAPDYDGQCFRAGQVFLPRTGAWDKISRAVKADFDDTVWEHLRGSVSAPFVAGEQVAVKVIDDRGNELMVVKQTEEEMK